MFTFAIVLIALVAFYLYNTRTFDYWKKRGVKHDNPVIFFGNNADNFLMRKSNTVKTTEIYWKYHEEKIVGFFRSTRPELVIRDPDIIKHVLASDFNYFYSRGYDNNWDRIESILRNLFFADGDLWKLLRKRMTPAFTSGKLKAMFPLIVERAERLQERVLALAAAGTRSFDARDLMARYTTDFIGACGFGIDANSLNQEDCVIRKLGAAVFKTNVKRFLSAVLKELMPRLFASLRPFAEIDQDINHLFRTILRQRNYQRSNRNDFVDILIESKEKGVITEESIEHMKPDGTPEIVNLEMNEELMAAQAFLFFVAGFETSSTATSYALHLLAYNPDVQKKVQDEIDRVLDRHNNRLSYDAVSEMTYLNWTLKESLRMFPPGGYLRRECARKYTIPKTNVTIDKGVRITIPVQGLHMDPQYFEDPESFRPERFDPDIFNSTQNNVYLPFGAGPRACIGERLAMMQSLAGLVAVLSKVEVAPAPESLRRPIVDPKFSIVQTVVGGLPLLCKQRK